MATRAVVPRGRPHPHPQPVTVRDGDIAQLARSLQRSPQAANLSPSTIRIYTISVAQLADFLASVACHWWCRT
jgi:hypothetical protein